MLLERARPLAADPVERAEIDSLAGADRDQHRRARRRVRAARAQRARHGHRGRRARASTCCAVACMAGGYARRPRGRRPDRARWPSGSRWTDTPGRPLPRRTSLHGAGAFFAERFDAAAPQPAGRARARGRGGRRRAPRSCSGLLLIAGGAGLFLGDDVAAQRLQPAAGAPSRATRARSPCSRRRCRGSRSRRSPTGQWAAAGGRRSTEGAASSRGRRASTRSSAHMRVRAGAARRACAATSEECRALAAESARAGRRPRARRTSRTPRAGRCWCSSSGSAAPTRRSCTRARSPRRRSRCWAALDRIEVGGPRGRARRPPAPGWPRSRRGREAAARRGRSAAAQHGRALLCDDADEAEHAFAAALALHAGAGRPFDRARTELAFGEHLRRARRRVEAREHLRAALDGFEALGAARVGGAGAGRAARQRPDRPPARRQHARRADRAGAARSPGYVAEGLTNREVAAQLFLSPRTIDFHLRNVFRKLGISSRIELARLDLAAGREVASVGP